MYQIKKRYSQITQIFLISPTALDTQHMARMTLLLYLSPKKNKYVSDIQENYVSICTGLSSSPLESCALCECVQS